MNMNIIIHKCNSCLLKLMINGEGKIQKFQVTRSLRCGKISFASKTVT